MELNKEHSVVIGARLWLIIGTIRIARMSVLFYLVQIGLDKHFANVFALMKSTQCG